MQICQLGQCCIWQWGEKSQRSLPLWMHCGWIGSRRLDRIGSSCRNKYINPHLIQKLTWPVTSSQTNLLPDVSGVWKKNRYMLAWTPWRGFPLNLYKKIIIMRIEENRQKVLISPRPHFKASVMCAGKEESSVSLHLSVPQLSQKNLTHEYTWICRIHSITQFALLLSCFCV